MSCALRETALLFRGRAFSEVDRLSRGLIAALNSSALVGGSRKAEATID